MDDHDFMNHGTRRTHGRAEFLFLLSVFSVCSVVSSHAAGTSAAQAWDPGEPVVTYWSGPGCSGKNHPPLTEKWLELLAAGGFNTVWATTPEEIDLAGKWGMRAIYALKPDSMRPKFDLDDPEQAAFLADRVAAVKDHPALYAYQHYDEAPATMFPALARVEEFVEGIDPVHPCWHNLLPTYAPNRLLGTEGEPARAYWEHLLRFCETYRPKFVTYDHYQFSELGDKWDYLFNLGMVRRIAASEGVPFWNGLQGCQWVVKNRASPKAPRIPTPEEMRYLVYSTAAYGAHGLYWYVFCRINHTGAMCEPDGTLNPDGKFDEVSKLNRAFVAISRQLRPLRFRGAFLQGRHAPGTTPYCAQALLKLSPETPPSELDPEKMESLDDTTLVSRFDDPAGRPSHLMVVNCDYRKDRTLRIDAPAPLERFDDATGAWSPVGASFDQPFVRGGGVLFRFAGSTIPQR